MSKRRKKVRFGRPDLPLWKAIPLATLAFLLFSALLLFIPPFLSRSALVVGGILILLGLSSVLWARFHYSPWAELLGNFIWPLQFMAAASRAWVFALPIDWVSLIPLWFGFILASALPVLNPRFSKFLWWEQFAPRTMIGRALMAIVLALFPAGGMIGAIWGQYGSRYLGREAVWLGGAILFTAAAFGYAFHVSYSARASLWEKATSDSQTLGEA